jgi:hypothetical protein
MNVLAAQLPEAVLTEAVNGTVTIIEPFPPIITVLVWEAVLFLSSKLVDFTEIEIEEPLGAVTRTFTPFDLTELCFASSTFTPTGPPLAAAVPAIRPADIRTSPAANAVDMATILLILSISLSRAGWPLLPFAYLNTGKRLS